MIYNIAIDGPAGAGKSTIAKKLAKDLGFVYVDTGAMYRCATLDCLNKNILPEELEKIETKTLSLDNSELFKLMQLADEKSKETKETAYYTPGIYTSCLMLGEETVNVAVTVDENHINSVEIVNLSDSVATMYPLVKPAMEDISNQIINNQSTDDITYSKSNQYTSIVLLDAVNDALSKAKIRAT